MKVHPALVRDLEQIEFGLRSTTSARRRHAIRQFHSRRAETTPQHDVHHALIGAIAIFQRNFLRQNIDPRNRLGRQIADFGEARDALSIQQHHRCAAATAAAARLRREFGEQFGDRTNPVGADVGGRKLLFGRNVTDHRAGLLGALDNDIGAIFALVGDRRGLLGRRGGSGLLLRQREGWGRGEGERQQGRYTCHCDSIIRSQVR